MYKIQVSKVAEFSGHKDAIFCLQCSDDRRKLYTGASDGMIVEWDAINPGDGQLIVKVPSPVYSMLMEGEQGIYAGTSSGNLHYIDVEGKREKRNLQAHEGGVFCLLRLADRKILSSGGDGRVRVWSPDLQLLHSLEHSDKSARVMKTHPRLPLLAVGYSDFNIRIFDTRSFALVQTLEAHTNSVFSLAWTPDGSRLISGGRDAMLRIWDLEQDMKEIKAIPAHLYHINDISFSPSGKFFASASMDKTLKLWDAENFELLKVIDLERNGAHKHSVNKVIWLSDEKLASCSDDRTAMIFSLLVD